MQDRAVIRALLDDDFAQTGASRKDLVEATGLSPTKVSRAVNGLLKAGEIRNEGSTTRPHFRRIG